MTNVAEEVADILLSIKGVTLNPTQPYRFTNGLLSPIYIDNRLLISYPAERQRVIQYLVEQIKEIGNFDVIAGTSTAGIPHAAWIAHEMNLPMVYVRGKAKEHGKKSQIEGLLSHGQKAVIIEDLITTGKSCLETQRAIRESGGVADNIVAIYNYTLPQSVDGLKAANANLSHLTTFPIVVDVAVQRGQIGEEEREMVLDWLDDTPNWGKRHGFE